MDIKTRNLVNTLPKKFKPIARYVDLHESSGSLAHLRFAQDTITNWVPKAVFARSVADFSDMSFLEFSESMLVYFGPALLGQGIFRKIYSKKLSPKLQKLVAEPTGKLLKQKNPNNKIIMPIKAAIAVSSLAIPLTEYSLYYLKNLFTMKFFKQGNFNNIANLNTVKTENKAQQQKVKENAKKHIKIAGSLIAGCLGFAALLATKGKNSKPLQSISETILAPGNKLFKNDVKKAAGFNKYFSIDFDSTEVKDKAGNKVLDKFGNVKKKLVLSKGQLMSCVLFGFAGCLGAAKDRGKQNFIEDLFRFPVVTFYVVTGAEKFIDAYKAILRKKGLCKEIVGKDKNFKTRKLKDLPELAKELAKKNGTAVETEFKKLFKQKAAVIGIPTLFSFFVMGLFVAGYSRFFTQYRFNKEKENTANSKFA